MGYSSALDLRQLPGTPNDPPSGTTLLYVKSDGLLYKKTLSVESPVDTTGSGVPTGCIMAWLVATPPAGWLLCDGTAIPAQYTNLIALIGANTPDLTGRFLLGAGTTNTSGNNRALGATGGSDQITTGMLPAHTHAAGTNLNATINRRTTAGTTGGVAMGAGVAQADLSANVAGTTGDGPGNSNPSLPPWYGINWIIKT